MSLEVFLHLPATIEPVGSGQIAALHLVIDGLGINETAFTEVEVNACTQEFLCQQGHVEVVGVVAGNIAASKYLFNLFRQLLEGWLVLDVIVADACQLHNLIGNGLFGIDQFVAANLASVRKYLDIRNLDDAVLDHVKSRRLQIKYHQWFLKIQFHSSIFLYLLLTS